MLSKVIPAAACMSTIVTFTRPTMIGTLVKVAMKIPACLKTIKKVKSSIEKEINELSKETVPTVSSETVNTESTKEET